MSYKSPIELIMSDMQIRMEGKICNAVQNVGVNVDKEELLKALQYDRDQYQKGYDDRDSEIVRCKDCADGHLLTLPDGKKVIECREYLCHEPDWFCADGVRKDG